MVAPGLAAVALLGAATGATLAFVGRVTLRRAPQGEARPAALMFSAWWLAAGVAIVVQSSHAALGAVGVLDATLHATLLYANAAPLAVGLCGLLCYLVYVHTGSRRAFGPIVAAYALFFGFTVFVYARLGPWSVVAGEWDVRLVPANDEPALTLVFGTLFALPALVAAVGYAALLVRVREPEQRYRVGLVSGAFVLLFGALLLGFALRWHEASWYALSYQLPGLAAALLVLAAFRPPAWVGRRWGKA